MKIIRGGFVVGVKPAIHTSNWPHDTTAIISRWFVNDPAQLNLWHNEAGDWIVIRRIV